MFIVTLGQDVSVPLEENSADAAPARRGRLQEVDGGIHPRRSGDYPGLSSSPCVAKISFEGLRHVADSLGKKSSGIARTGPKS